MANQYSGSFEHKVREKYNCTAEELLVRCADENLTYMDIEKKLGVTSGTIRKWARRYGIHLDVAKPSDVEKEHIQLFKSEKLNTYNFLSRRWSVN